MATRFFLTMKGRLITILNMTVPFNTDEFLFLDPSLESAFYIVAAFNSKPCPVVELERKILGHFLLWFPNF